jgi:hypothetical protein
MTSTTTAVTTPMAVKIPSGKAWELTDVNRKLTQRAGLPGARVFDLSADSLRVARAKGLSDEARLPLALPGSWLVNSPAQSFVFRRWALSPHKELMLDILALFDPPRLGPLEPDAAAALAELVAALGKEATLIEAASKVLALLVPHAIPLMPPLAVGHVLGPGVALDPAAFVAMVSWFGESVAEHWEGLSACAAAHTEVPLDAAQVLDRLLWFDSDGFKHFQKAAG